MLKILFVSFLLLTLTGCSSIFGTAAYKYSHVDKNGASCSITVGSLRDVQGASVTIDKNCLLSVSVDSLTANEAMAKAVLNLTEKLPQLPLGPVVP